MDDFISVVTIDPMKGRMIALCGVSMHRMARWSGVSDAITSALNVVSVGEKFIFSNALRGRGNVFDRLTGKVVGGVDHNYACCRFTLSEPYILGANMDMVDLSDGGKLVSTGPAIDSRECLGAVVSNGRIFLYVASQRIYCFANLR